MPTPTYTPLATVTLGSSAATVTFSNIPATYRDLVLVGSVQTASTTDSTFRVNGDSGDNYNSVVMWGNGSTANSAQNTNAPYSFWAYSNSTSFAAAVIQFMDYSATDKHKTMLVRNGTAADLTGARAVRWASTSAITSITLFGGISGGTNLQTGSTFSLYGVIA